MASLCRIHFSYHNKEKSEVMIGIWSSRYLADDGTSRWHRKEGTKDPACGDIYLAPFGSGPPILRKEKLDMNTGRILQLCLCILYSSLLNCFVDCIGFRLQSGFSLPQSIRLACPSWSDPLCFSRLISPSPSPAILNYMQPPHCIMLFNLWTPLCLFLPFNSYCIFKSQLQCHCLVSVCPDLTLSLKVSGSPPIRSHAIITFLSTVHNGYLVFWLLF